MPLITYGTGAYRRNNGNMPEVRLLNMFVEQAPTSETGAVLLSREGLSEHSAPGAGPVTAVFQQDGLFGGDVFTVSGGVLYRGTASIGAVPGSGPVSIDCSDTQIAVTAGTTLKYYDGTTLTSAAFPDGADVRKIIYHDGLWIMVRGDSGRFYWASNLASIDALNFATAESSADNLLDCLVLNDTLFLFGSDSIEPWANTGDAELPYTRIEQRIVERGIYGTGCVRKADNTFLWIGEDGSAYRFNEIPERVSDFGIEERIQASATVSAFAFQYQGHHFFAARLDGGTWAFDLATGQWCEFTTHGRDNFRGQCAATVSGAPLLGDDSVGKVWELSGWSDGGEALERRWTSYFPISGGAITIHNLSVETNVGWTGLLAGQGSDPTMEMRSSRDGGATWDGWRSATMGQQGQYRDRPQWRRCGLFDPPGGMFEHRVTDPVPVRVSSVRVNEPGGGRSR
jgi:hypothetical protein